MTQRDYLLPTHMLPREKLLRVIFHLQGGLCRYCREPMSERMGDVEHQDGWSRDHVRPRRAAGKKLAGNMVLACYACNQLKGGGPPKEEDVYYAAGLWRQAKKLHEQWDQLTARQRTKREPHVSLQEWLDAQVPRSVAA